MEQWLIILLAIPTAALAFAGLLYWFAKHNIFFTFVEEGTAKAITRFTQFHRILVAYQGFFPDSQGVLRQEIELDSLGNDEGLSMDQLGWKPVGAAKGVECRSIADFLKEGKKPESVEWYQKDDTGGQRVNVYIVVRELKQPHRFFKGLYWIGVPFVHEVFEYFFRWVSFEQTDREGNLTDKVVSHKGWLDYILLKDDVYYTLVDRAETSDFIQVDVKLLLTIRVMNPYKAFFRVQNWLEASLNLVKPAFREFVVQYPFDKLIALRHMDDVEGKNVDVRKRGIEREADKFLKETGIGRYLERNYGVRLKKVGIVDIAAAGERGKEYMEAAVKMAEANKEKERIKILADAETERMTRVYQTVKDFGEVGIFLKGTETLQKIGEGPSNLVLFPMGSAQDLFKAVTGKEQKPNLVIPSSKGGA